MASEPSVHSRIEYVIFDLDGIKSSEPFIPPFDCLPKGLMIDSEAVYTKVTSAATYLHFPQMLTANFRWHPRQLWGRDDMGVTPDPDAGNLHDIQHFFLCVHRATSSQLKAGLDTLHPANDLLGGVLGNHLVVVQHGEL